jgi:hypothetical protein
MNPLFNCSTIEWLQLGPGKKELSVRKKYADSSIKNVYTAFDCIVGDEKTDLEFMQEKSRREYPAGLIHHKNAMLRTCQQLFNIFSAAICA